MIAATTLDEYKAYVEEDEALARRFRCVHVPEPTIEETRRILYHVRPSLERNYVVQWPDEAIETALDLSPRNIRHLHLPDKVIGWLDTAAVHAEIARRSEVTRADVAHVISHDAQIPEDMVFRDVSGRFNGLEQRLQERVVARLQTGQFIDGEMSTCVRSLLNRDAPDTEPPRADLTSRL